MITILGNVCQFSAKNGILLRKPILQTFDTIFEKYVRSLKRHFGSHRLRIYFKIITSVLGIAKRTYWPRLAAIHILHNSVRIRLMILNLQAASGNHCYNHAILMMDLLKSI
jgi:hypothetical protein